MKTTPIVRQLSLVALLVPGLFVLRSSPAFASHVEPSLVLGNTSCEELGYDFGFKPQPEPPPDGTYYFPDGTNTVTIDTNGTYFDWTSTLGIDAVIVKGGPNSNVYTYEPPAEAFSDTGLHSPINPSTGTPFGISHIEFCYDYELTVSKTAETSFTRTYQWNIDKSVDPEEWDLFTGDNGTSMYTVTVDQTGHTDSDWAVSGTITIENETPFDATISSVSDVISGYGGVTVTCGVTFPYLLAAGATLNCTYGTALPNGNDRTNTALVTTSGEVGGGTDSAAVTFGDPTTEVNASISVVDTNGESWEFDGDGSATYERTFTCDEDEGTHHNTATIVETGQSDSASVTVNCHALLVTKDASTSFDRTWSWTIDKEADASDLLLSEGQLLEVNYSVTVMATYTDSGWAVEGEFRVHNPAPIDATINTVSDVISPAVNATVDCGVTFPYTLAAGGNLDCTYSASLPDGVSRTNTATATLQNYSYSSSGTGMPVGTTDFSGSAMVSFAGAAVTEIDECIEVSDTNDGVLGNVCAADAPHEFLYSLWFGTPSEADVVLECGENTHTNTASFVTYDTGATGSDSWTVQAEAACEEGCTLTPGYWKTHSHHGPAPADDAWFLLGDVDGDGVSEGADETFFLSGKTYYEVLWTTPSSGNAYYILAHAYIAAVLNVANDADSTPEVDAAIAWSETFFNTYKPTSTLPKSVRNKAISTADTLDDYNNGLVGPGHCSE